MVSHFVAAAALTILAWVAISDLRARRIPNVASASLLGLWIVHAAFVEGRSPTTVDLLVPALVFAVGFLIWQLGLIGGGDVKLLTVMGLWAGGSHAVSFLLGTGLLGGALAIGTLALHRAHLFLPLPAVLVFQRLGAPVLAPSAPSLPYGVAISLAGMWVVLETLPS